MELLIDQVSKKYGSKQALGDFSLRLGSGVLGLLGPNGAGKSTLMKILATLMHPTEGKVTLDGINIVNNPKELRKNLGYLPQDFGVYPNLNAIEFLEYMAAVKGLPMKLAKLRIQDLLEALNLAQDAKRKIGGYSGGMKQRVGIAQALLNDPKVLIVDEPTVGLDPEERIRFRNLLANMASGRIIILSTHIVSDIESLASQIAIMSEGRLLQHTLPEDLLVEMEGKVWECTVPSRKLPELQQSHVVSRAFQRSDGMHVRIISNRRPFPDAEMIAPTLEDAYLYYISVRTENGGDEE
ncbi:ABC transporter ATP-binding protein [Pseudogracilibacillus sp. SO30301A]|uniref:ABC transporter ATP-binding protein n=1 Tax=Pseudogracilibacillus sp. SO30301A TaxID=3098291 RepID=UPI00300E3C60